MVQKRYLNDIRGTFTETRVESFELLEWFFMRDSVFCKIRVISENGRGILSEWGYVYTEDGGVYPGRSWTTDGRCRSRNCIRDPCPTQWYIFRGSEKSHRHIQDTPAVKDHLYIYKYGILSQYWTDSARLLSSYSWGRVRLSRWSMFELR